MRDKKKEELCIICKRSGVKIGHIAGTEGRFCEYCSLEWRFPFPTDKELLLHYRDGYFNEQGSLKRGYANYEKFRESLEEYFERILGKVYGYSRKGLLVDVGSGYGYFLNLARGRGYKVVGVDLSKEAISYAKERYGLEVKMGFFEKLPFPNKSIDVVTCFQTFEHMSDPVRFLKSCKKRLRKGGVLLLTTPDRGCLWRKLLRNKWFSYRHDEHMYFWDRQSLEKALVKTGFASFYFFNDDLRWYTASEIYSLLRSYGGKYGQVLPEIGFEKSLLKLRIPFLIGSFGVVVIKE